MFDLEGKVVAITGALGQLGRAYSKAFLDQGAIVALCDTEQSAHLFEENFKNEAASQKAVFFPFDVSDGEAVKKSARIIATQLGVPSILINNAAIDSPPDVLAGSDSGPFETFPEGVFERVLDVNTKGVFLCCREFGSLMAHAGRGSIINIGSIYGKVSPDQSLYQYRRERGEIYYKPVAYSVSKSAIYNLTRYLAVYWGKVGVRVNTLTLAGVANNQDECFVASYTSRIPIGRMAQPSDYIGPIFFLASDASRYMTGSDLVVDGGWTAV